MNTKKEKKVVLLQIDKKFLDEEYSHVDDALEDAKEAFRTYEGLKHAKAYIATVIDGYVKRCPGQRYCSRCRSRPPGCR